MSRKILLLWVLGLVGGRGVVQGQSPTLPAGGMPSPAPWANKFFLPDIAQNPTQAPPPMITKDFKEVPHGTLCSHTFTITNIYDEPMQIIEVRKSCHCLDYVPMPQMLKPNESASFTVTMDAGKFVGYNAQTLYVTFGPKYISTAVIRLSATSKADVTLNPGAVAFGTVALGSSVTRSVEVEYRGPRLRDSSNRSIDWKLTGVLPHTLPVDVAISDVKSSGLGLGLISRPPKYRVDVTLKPTALPGSLHDQIALTTNDPNNPLVQVTVTATVQAPLEIAPQSVRFDSVSRGEEASQRVIVRGGRPFRIISVDGQDESLQVEMPPISAPLPVHVLTIRYRPQAAGLLQRVLRIQTDLEGKISVNLPVEAGEPR